MVVLNKKKKFFNYLSFFLFIIYKYNLSFIFVLFFLSFILDLVFDYSYLHQFFKKDIQMFFSKNISVILSNFQIDLEYLEIFDYLFIFFFPLLLYRLRNIWFSFFDTIFSSISALLLKSKINKILLSKTKIFKPGKIEQEFNFYKREFIFDSFQLVFSLISFISSLVNIAYFCYLLLQKRNNNYSIIFKKIDLIVFIFYSLFLILLIFQSQKKFRQLETRTNIKMKSYNSFFLNSFLDNIVKNLKNKVKIKTFISKLSNKIFLDKIYLKILELLLKLLLLFKIVPLCFFIIYLHKKDYLRLKKNLIKDYFYHNYFLFLNLMIGAFSSFLPRYNSSSLIKFTNTINTLMFKKNSDKVYLFKNSLNFNHPINLNNKNFTCIFKGFNLILNERIFYKQNLNFFLTKNKNYIISSIKIPEYTIKFLEFIYNDGNFNFMGYYLNTTLFKNKFFLNLKTLNTLLNIKILKFLFQFYLKVLVKFNLKESIDKLEVLMKQKKFRVNSSFLTNREKKLFLLIYTIYSNDTVVLIDDLHLFLLNSDIKILLFYIYQQKNKTFFISLNKISVDFKNYLEKSEIIFL